MSVYLFRRNLTVTYLFIYSYYINIIHIINIQVMNERKMRLIESWSRLTELSVSQLFLCWRTGARPTVRDPGGTSL